MSSAAVREAPTQSSTCTGSSNSSLAPLTHSLTVLASKLRAAIEACPKSYLPITFQDFPIGSCGDACLVLGAWLSDHGHPQAIYVCGERDGHSHAWLDLSGVLIDITADQFPNMPSVYVGPRNSFYLGFEIEFTNPRHFNAYDDKTKFSLHSAYKNICRYVA